MKSNKQVKKEFYRLRQAEIENLKIIKSEIDYFIKVNKVNEEGLRILNNMTTTLSAFKEGYLSRLFNFLKQGDIID